MLKLLTREELSHAKEFVLYSNDALYVITQNDNAYRFEGAKGWSFSETFWDNYESDLLMNCFKLISIEEALDLLENRGYSFPSHDETTKQNSALLDMAVRFAVDHHAGHFRKGTDIPYILHPIEVMNTLRTMNADIPLLVAGVLHDTVEDTDATPDEISELFGGEVAALVASNSEDKSKSWDERKQHTIDELATAPPPVKKLVLADKISNLRSIGERLGY